MVMIVQQKLPRPPRFLGCLKMLTMVLRRGVKGAVRELMSPILLILNWLNKEDRGVYCGMRRPTWTPNLTLRHLTRLLTGSLDLQKLKSKQAQLRVSKTTCQLMLLLGVIISQLGKGTLMTKRRYLPTAKWRTCP
ncbi:unnamed protein product [Coregonus sp. 'balchen']|nr:unnamed protein product [Coregonus sp. 'balchen']